MKKTYTFCFWHGSSKALEERLNRVKGVSFSIEDTGIVYTYTGTLDDFSAQYGHVFMVLPSDVICVTQHNGFGAR